MVILLDFTINNWRFHEILMGYPLVIQQFATEAMANKKFDDLTYE